MIKFTFPQSGVNFDPVKEGFCHNGGQHQWQWQLVSLLLFFIGTWLNIPPSLPRMSHGNWDSVWSAYKVNSLPLLSSSLPTTDVARIAISHLFQFPELLKNPDSQVIWSQPLLLHRRPFLPESGCATWPWPTLKSPEFGKTHCLCWHLSESLQDTCKSWVSLKRNNMNYLGFPHSCSPHQNPLDEPLPPASPPE